MGDKLGQMVKVSYLILVIFFLNISAELDKVSIKPISPENISLHKDAKIYEVSASFNNMILKSSKISKPNKTYLQKFSTISKKDRYAIQVLDEKAVSYTHLTLPTNREV